MSRPQQSFWQLNPDKLPVLIILREQATLSAGQMAMRLGCTRNAVIGKLRRIGLPSLYLGAHTRTDGRLNFHNKIPKQKPIPVPQPHDYAKTPSLATTAGPALKTRHERAKAPSKAKLIVDLKPNQCKFSTGQDSQDRHLFCGGKTDGGPWCKGHAKRVYKKAVAYG